MCGKSNLSYNTELLHLPYFNEVMSTTFLCDSCSYRYSDILILEQNTPMESRIEISRVEDLTIRVIRSSSATIELPELGIKIEPATASEAFVSNVEGVIVRIISAVESAIAFSDDMTKKGAGTALLERLRKLREGSEKVTLIIKDPMGNSGIISAKTETRELSPDEIKTLETGITIIDLNTIKDEILD